MRASRSSSPKACRLLPISAARVLLEVGPQPVLTAAALRAWPESVTTPRAIASLRRNGADQRQITRGARARPTSRDIVPTSRIHQRGPAASSTCPPIRSSTGHYWFPTGQDQPVLADAMRTETVRLLEEDRIDELAALLDGADGNGQTADVLETTCLSNTINNATRSPSPTPATRSAGRKPLPQPPSPTPVEDDWLLIADDAQRTSPPLARWRHAGTGTGSCDLPESDADEANCSKQSCVKRQPLNQRCASCMSPASTRTAQRRRGRWRGCNTGSSAEHGGSSAPPRPRGCTHPSGWSPAAHSGSQTPTPSHPRSHACGDSVAPHPWSIPKCGVGWRIWLTDGDRRVAPVDRPHRGGADRRGPDRPAGSARSTSLG